MSEELNKLNDLLDKEINSGATVLKTISKYESKLDEKWHLDLEAKALEEKKDMLIHSKYVLKIAIEIAIENGSDIDMDLLAISAFIHDISKYEEEDDEQDEGRKHNSLGSDYILKEASKLDLADIGPEKVATIVKSHRGDMEEITDSSLELIARIVRDADKISKIYKPKNWKTDKSKKKKVIESIIENIDTDVKKKHFLKESKVVYEKHKKRIERFLEHNL